MHECMCVRVLNDLHFYFYILTHGLCGDIKYDTYEFDYPFGIVENRIARFYAISVVPRFLLK